MKRCRLSYDEWKCVVSKEVSGKRVNADFFEGYVGLIEIRQVSEVQKWKWHEREIVVCDKGSKWLTILPQHEFYCITAMADDMDELEEALRQKDITQEQFHIALRTADELKKGLLKNIEPLRKYTNACCECI